MVMKEELSSMSTAEVLRLYTDLMRELRSRQLNNPVADLAELLVCEALQLKRAPRNNAGYDATDADVRYQIKGRRLLPEFQSMELGRLGNLDE